MKVTLGLLTLAALSIIRWDNPSLIYQLLIELMACKDCLKLLPGLIRLLQRCGVHDQKKSGRSDDEWPLLLFQLKIEYFRVRGG